MTDEQRQCLNNILALMRYHKIPLSDLALLKAEQDRCTFRLTGRYLAFFNGAVADGKFKRRGFKFWKEEYREQVPHFAAEVNIDRKKRLVMVDIDEKMPWWDVVRLFGHIKEVCRNHFHRVKTDPFLVMAGLRKRGVAVADVRVA